MSAAVIAEDPQHSQDEAVDGDIASQDLPAWISPGLMAHTRAIWSRHLQRPVSRQEAAIMLMNVQRLAVVIIDHLQHVQTPSEDVP